MHELTIYSFLVTNMVSGKGFIASVWIEKTFWFYWNILTHFSSNYFFMALFCFNCYVCSRRIWQNTYTNLQQSPGNVSIWICHPLGIGDHAVTVWRALRVPWWPLAKRSNILMGLPVFTKRFLFFSFIILYYVGNKLLELGILLYITFLSKSYFHTDISYTAKVTFQSTANGR